MYTFYNEKDKCELNECQEYPEISPGCIICNDKLNEYKSNKKCQSCKYGYFMTKEETCVYCRSENYGGPACYECGYEVDKNGNEKDNIICKDCYLYEKYRYLYEGYYYDRYDYSYIFNSILSSDVKCYNYKRNSSDNCLLYGSIKDKNNIEKLTCTMCIPGYYFNSENKCISYKDKIKIFPNWRF